MPLVSMYDDLGRLESVTDADGTRTFEWDTAPSGIGRIARTTSGDDVAVAYAYEPRGLLETTTWTHGASQPTHESFTLGYVHDAIGRLEEVRYPERAIDGASGCNSEGECTTWTESEPETADELYGLAEAEVAGAAEALANDTYDGLDSNSPDAVADNPAEPEGADDAGSSGAAAGGAEPPPGDGTFRDANALAVHSVGGAHAAREPGHRERAGSVAILVYKDGANAGKVATAIVPSPQQLANWGVK